MNQETPTYYFRYKKRLEEDADGRRSSRFLGANYLLLALFIGVSFYFFFPRLFQQNKATRRSRRCGNVLPRCMNCKPFASP